MYLLKGTQGFIYWVTNVTHISLSHKNISGFDHSELLLFSKFVYFKYLYGNGVIYNYSPSAEKRSGFSTNTVRSLCNKFISRGWCQLRQGHLIFTPFHAILDQDRIRKTIRLAIPKDKFNYKTILQALQYYVIRTKIKQIRYAVHCKCDRVNPKKLLKLQTSSIESAANKRTQLSYSAISQMFSCSLSHAKKIVDQLILNGWLKREKTPMRFMVVTHPQQARAFSNTTAFFHNGILIFPSACSYKLTGGTDLPLLAARPLSEKEKSNRYRLKKLGL